MVMYKKMIGFYKNVNQRFLILKNKQTKQPTS